MTEKTKKQYDKKSKLEGFFTKNVVKLGKIPLNMGEFSILLYPKRIS
jgi:hypothetical protein